MGTERRWRFLVAPTTTWPCTSGIASTISSRRWRSTRCTVRATSVAWSWAVAELHCVRWVPERMSRAGGSDRLTSGLAAGRGTSCLSGDNMTEPKRALPPRPRRGVWILITVPLVLLVAATLILFGLKRQAGVGTLPIPLEPSQSTTPVAHDSTPTTPSTDPTAKAAKAKAARAATALKGCRAKVQAADEVMAAGKDGMRHWAEHVQAQTDAFAGEITVGKMEDIFARTMKDGDGDEKHYIAAIKSYHHRDGSCRPVAGAPAKVTKQLARCADRGRAQRPVLAAAEDGMADWTKHLAEMRRSKHGKVHNPQQKWLKTWRAAAPHINAYDKAADRFSAPTC